MTAKDTGFNEKINDILEKLNPEEKKLFYQIIELEKNKLYMFRPSGIIEEIVDAVRSKIN